jgi:hypothetical protein
MWVCFGNIVDSHSTRDYVVLLVEFWVLGGEGAHNMCKVILSHCKEYGLS